MRMKPYICDRLNKPPSEWNRVIGPVTMGLESDTETKLLVSLIAFVLCYLSLENEFIGVPFENGIALTSKNVGEGDWDGFAESWIP